MSEKTIVNIPKNPSPIKAIRKYCLQCGDGTRIEVEKCHITNCPLHPYRFGIMPYTYAERKGLVPKRPRKKKSE